MMPSLSTTPITVRSRPVPSPKVGRDYAAVAGVALRAKLVDRLNDLREPIDPERLEEAVGRLGMEDGKVLLLERPVADVFACQVDFAGRDVRVVVRRLSPRLPPASPFAPACRAWRSSSRRSVTR